MTSKPVYEPIDLTTWNFGLDLENIVAKAVNETINEAFKEDPPVLEFFVNRERANADDELLVVAVLPLSPNDVDPVGFGQSLESIVGTFIADNHDDDEMLDFVAAEMQRQINRLKERKAK